MQRSPIRDETLRVPGPHTGHHGHCYCAFGRLSNNRWAYCGTSCNSEGETEHVAICSMRAVRLHRPAAPGMLVQMLTGRAPPRGAKRAAPHAYDFAWTAITIIVVISVAIAVAAFYWFID